MGCGRNRHSIAVVGTSLRYRDRYNTGEKKEILSISKGAVMPVDKKVQKALQPKNLKLPPKTRVLAIDVEDYVTWEGEDALRVWVTIPDNTPDEELLDGEAWTRLHMSIHDVLLQRGVTLFPYMRITTPGEKSLADEEE
jgi:hypothetical protein